MGIKFKIGDIVQLKGYYGKDKGVIIGINNHLCYVLPCDSKITPFAFHENDLKLTMNGIQLAKRIIKGK
jgi:hypothetical protein